MGSLGNFGLPAWYPSLAAFRLGTTLARDRDVPPVARCEAKAPLNLSQLPLQAPLHPYGASSLVANGRGMSRPVRLSAIEKASPAGVGE